MPDFENFGTDDHKIINADCLEYLKTLPDESVDLVVTDPPYNIGDENKLTKKNGQIQSNKETWGVWDNYDKKEWLLFVKKVFSEIDRCLKKRGSLVCFYDKFDITYLRDFGIELGWHPLNFYALIKKQPLPNMRKAGFLSGFELSIVFNKCKEERTFNFLGQTKMINYFSYNNTIHETEHPTEKPIKAIQRLISIFSCQGDVVLDPFLGSGTTLIASKMLGRKGIGVEISREYCEIARKRLLNVPEKLEGFFE